MSKDKENYGGRFLYSDDLIVDGKFHSPTVTVDKFYPARSLEAADKKIIDKPSVSFVGSEKILVLCKTNLRLFRWATGNPLSEKSAGIQIKIQVRMIKAFGEIVPAIRIIPPKGMIPKKLREEGLGTVAVWGEQPEESHASSR